MSNFDLNALSGINAMSQGMGVISNNLANSQTVGFKTSRAEFADLFSGAQNSPGNGVRVNNIVQDFTQGTISTTGRELDLAIDGEGFFILSDAAGQFGSIYTRNGSFKVDKDGFVTDQNGNILQGFNQIPELSTELNPVFSTALQGINLGQLSNTPRATDFMTYNLNLDGSAEVNKTSVGDLINDEEIGGVNNYPNIQALFRNEYTGFPDYIYPKTIHDSLGGEHELISSFYSNGVVSQADSLIDANGNGVTAGNGVKYSSWLVQYTIEDKNGNPSATLVSPEDAAPPAGPLTGQVYELRFDTNGRYIGTFIPTTGGTPADPTAIPPTIATPGAPVTYQNATAFDLAALDAPLLWGRLDELPSLNFVLNESGATDPLGLESNATAGVLQILVDFSDMTQFASDYALRGVTQNGFKVGDLAGLSIDSSGIIEARYSNGRNLAVAQLALGNFNDLNALQKLGGQMYAESFGSGPVQISAAGAGTVGKIRAGSLEFSNVDVAAELVKMIQLQRTYQASAQVISTSQELTRTILNL